MEEHLVECFECGDPFSEARAALGYNVCLACGERVARQERSGWCVAPAGHKQGDTLHTTGAASGRARAYLSGLNKTIR